MGWVGGKDKIEEFGKGLSSMTFRGCDFSITPVPVDVEISGQNSWMQRRKGFNSCGLGTLCTAQLGCNSTGLWLGFECHLRGFKLGWQRCESCVL